MKRVIAVLLLALAGALASIPAYASTLLYSNATGSSGNGGGLSIVGDAVSDSFTVNSNSTLTGLNFDYWVVVGDSLTSLEWSIGTSPDGNNDGSGTVSGAALESLGQVNGNESYTVFEDEFVLPSISLTAGTTYYLTFQDGVTAEAHNVYWDYSGGPSSASFFTSGFSYTIGDSQTFNLYGNVAASAATPEPSSLLLLGTGLLGVGLLCRAQGQVRAPRITLLSR